MTIKWNNGDVALVRCSDGEERLAIYGERFSITSWTFQDGVYRYVSGSVARPLLVIDPENDEDVARLHHAVLPSTFMSNTKTYPDTRRALQSLLPNDDPEEPTGAGAVVVDGHSNIWVRVVGDDQDNVLGPWQRRGVTAKKWESLLRPVTVLSEGVALAVGEAA